MTIRVGIKKSGDRWVGTIKVRDVIPGFYFISTPRRKEKVFVKEDLKKFLHMINFKETERVLQEVG